MAAIKPRGYLSDDCYHFEEEQADAIIRTTSYHREDFNQSVIWFSDQEHQGVRASISTSFQRPPSISDGALDRLPQELLNNIFLSLDIRSLTKCRQVNLRLRQAVDSLSEYQAICTHALNVVCALLRTRLARNVSLFDFYQALCTKNCDLCPRFGGFIFLPTWRRCCFMCLRSGDLELQMQTVVAIRHQLSLLSVAAIRQLSSFKTLPGLYSLDEGSVPKARVVIAPVEQAMKAAEEQQEGVQEAALARFRQDRKLTLMSSCALPYYDRQSRTTECGVSCAGAQRAIEKAPVGSLAMGGKWANMARDIIYGKDSFLEHFKSCKEAQLLWESSNEGSLEPPDLPQGAKDGGYFNRRE